MHRLTIRAVSIASLWLCSIGLAIAAESVMTVVIVYGAPGHSAVHLQHKGQQLYWDPGGEYGTERDDCLKESTEKYCARFAGFPWAKIKAARQDDVFLGEAADLMQLISVYHLDGDEKIKIYRFDINGTVANKAWSLLAGPLAEDFDPDREPMFCVKGVTEFLEELGGQFKGIDHPWYPSELGDEMARIGAKPSDIFTLYHPKVDQAIQQIRQKAGLKPKQFVNDWDVVETDESAL
ncbi:MAG: hypothetical protein HOM11_05830 [Methylococcales bacterium]|nr:hypothetical protein [Methylococcales bacterium]MBT7444675.1 hypothetical protein [Methylococcales bacterium]